MAVAHLFQPFAHEGRGERSLSAARFGTFRRLWFGVGVIVEVFQFHRSCLSELLHDNIAAAAKFLKTGGDDAA